MGGGRRNRSRDRLAARSAAKAPWRRLRPRSDTDATESGCSFGKTGHVRARRVGIHIIVFSGALKRPSGGTAAHRSVSFSSMRRFRLLAAPPLVVSGGWDFVKTARAHPRGGVGERGM